jgi:preprotein translocase subunit SecE
MIKNTVKFFREVRLEGSKVTWPTRSETMMTTVVVFIMISIVALILTVADLLISNSVQFILGLGN